MVAQILQALRIRTRRDVAWLGGIILLSGLISSALPSGLAFTHALEMWGRDIRIALATPAEPQNEDIVIVAITDATLDALPYHFPIDRAFMANLINRLDQLGARAIGIDLLLDSETEPEKDNLLIKAFEESRAPIIPIWSDNTFDVGAISGDKTESSRDKKKRLGKLQRFVGDNPAGHGVAFLDTFDRTARRQKPVWDPDSPYPFQFPAAIAHALGVEFDKSVAPIAWWGKTVKGEKPFKQYPAHWIDLATPEWIDGKVVLIGVDLVDIDRHRTPFNLSNWRERMAGIEIHAHALAQLLNGRALWVTSVPTNFVIGLLAGILGVVIALVRAPMAAKVVIGALIVILFWTCSFFIYRYGGPLYPVFMPVLALVAAISLTSVFDGRREREKRAFIRGAFARYVPPGIVSRLDQDPSRLQLGGERRQLTVLFTDLAGFTSFSEGLDAKLLAEIINDYLEGVASTVLRNGGTIDKFLGDGTMSFFGAPEPHDDDFDRAVTCAIEIDRFSDTFAEKWSAQGFDVGETRIGVYCGPAVVGNFGGRDRFDYTALGDTVNTASRLESANKFTNSRILIGSDGPLPPTSHRLRPVGKLILAGKSEPIAAYEPSPNDQDTDLYLSAYATLDGDPATAKQAFREILQQRPGDHLAQFHLDRLQNGETGTTILLKGK